MQRRVRGESESAACADAEPGSVAPAHPHDSITPYTYIYTSQRTMSHKNNEYYIKSLSCNTLKNTYKN